MEFKKATRSRTNTNMRTNEMGHVVDGFLEVTVTVVANRKTQLDGVGVFDGHHDAANGQMLCL